MNREQLFRYVQDTYGTEPQLCNYYCAKECEIGRQHIPEIKMKDLAQIVLEMLSSSNSAKRRQERLIEITTAGIILYIDG